MILTVDIGNTNVTFGGFEGDNLVFTARLATEPNHTADQYAVALDSVLRLKGVDPGLRRRGNPPVRIAGCRTNPRTHP